MYPDHKAANIGEVSFVFSNFQDLGLTNSTNLRNFGICQRFWSMEPKCIHPVRFEDVRDNLLCVEYNLN
jgi:hypothetical protein